MGGVWNLSKLLSYNRVARAVREEILGQYSDARPFVSWLLYGAGERGRGIRDPVGHAVSRLREAPGRGAGDPFDPLAALPPVALANLIERQALEGYVTTTQPSWRQAMGGAGADRLRDLAVQLGLRVEE